MIVKPFARLVLAGLLTFAGSAVTAAPIFSQIFINVPGTDDGYEFIELRGTPGESLGSYTIVIIEGDGTAAGTIDQAIALTGQSVGSNGFFLLRDSSSTTLTPAVPAATNVFVATALAGSTDIENGSNTYLLVTGFSGSTTTDLDADDNGTLDSTPWASVASAVSLIENDTPGPNIGYADDFGGTLFGPNAGYNADLLWWTGSAWAGSDVLGTIPGPFTVDGTRTSIPAAGGNTLTPGAGGPFLDAPSSVANWAIFE